MTIVRKRDTGEKGNAGEFGTTSRQEADVAVTTTGNAPDHAVALRAQGRSGAAIAELCEEIDVERDGGYAGSFIASTDDGDHEFYLRPSGEREIHVEYLYNRRYNDGAMTQATLDLETGDASITYQFDNDNESPIPHDVEIGAGFDHRSGTKGVADFLREFAVDDGAARDKLEGSFEDPDESARDAYLRGIGVRRHSYVTSRHRTSW